MFSKRLNPINLIGIFFIAATDVENEHTMETIKIIFCIIQFCLISINYKQY